MAGSPLGTEPLLLKTRNTISGKKRLPCHVRKMLCSFSATQDRLHPVQNHPQGNMNRIFHELTYIDKISYTSWLERDSNSHLRVSGPLFHRVNWEQYARFTQFKCTSSRISSVKLSRESLVHVNVVSNIKCCGISPLFHCPVHVPKICSHHIFYKAFVPNTSFHHLHILIFL